jgi:hypothetical protein
MNVTAPVGIRKRHDPAFRCAGIVSRSADWPTGRADAPPFIDDKAAGYAGACHRAARGADPLGYPALRAAAPYPFRNAKFNDYNLACDIGMVIDVGLGILQRCCGKTDRRLQDA